MPHNAMIAQLQKLIISSRKLLRYDKHVDAIEKLSVNYQQDWKIAIT